MDQFKTTSERIDDLPVLIYWLKRMQVDVIINQVLGPPHGNWEGLSYGEVALVFIRFLPDPVADDREYPSRVGGLGTQAAEYAPCDSLARSSAQ